MSDAFVGIDIGKFKFDVAVLTGTGTAKHRAFSNDQEGFEKLIAWLVSKGIEGPHFCMEATGRYGEKLAY